MWAVECLDTFEGVRYGRKIFPTKGKAEQYAKKRHQEVEAHQPSASAGSIQDRVYVIDPDGYEYQVR